MLSKGRRSSISIKSQIYRRQEEQLHLRALRVSRFGSVTGITVILLAALSFSAKAQQPTDDPRRLVAEQKIRLMENLLAAPMAHKAEASGNQEIRALLAKARQLLEAARSDLAIKKYEHAARTLDDALRTVSSASSALSRNDPGLTEGAHRARNTELIEQIQTYRASLAETVAQTGSEQAVAALGRLDKMAAEAQELMQREHHGEANKLLGNAYRHAVISLSRIRAGQTVVLEVKFDSPADEFAYEQKRNRSHEMLVNMTLEERRAKGPLRETVARRADESKKLRQLAEAQAAAGDYKSAIKTLELATGELVQALQGMGVAAF